MRFQMPELDYMQVLQAMLMTQWLNCLQESWSITLMQIVTIITKNMNIIAASAAADIMGVSLNVKMVSENDTEGPILIDFWAAWCYPCRMMSPVVAELAEEYEGKAKICKVNVDEEPELALAFKVMSIPMFAVIKNGQVTDSLVGARPKEDLEVLIK